MRAWLVAAALLAACGARSEIRGGALPDASAPDASAADANAPDLAPDFAWYKLDETSGTTAHDSAPHHWDIDVHGVTWDDGAIFDGQSVCGSTSVDAAFRTPPLTLTAWLTPSARDDETANAYALTPFPPDAVSGDVPAAGGYALGLDVWTDGASGRALAVETGANAAVAFHSEASSFADGERHFVALVIDANGAGIWVDGALAWHVTGNVPPSDSPAPLHLGCHNDDAGYGTKRFYKGCIRDARIYKRTLTAGEIAQLFANGPV